MLTNRENLIKPDNIYTIKKKGNKRMKEEKEVIQTGSYTLQESFFLMNGRKVVIKSRKKPAGKPERYLIGLAPFEYISSLFPVPDEEEAFTFDTGNTVYKMSISGGQVEIRKLE